jgi:hypothetical protein
MYETYNLWSFEYDCTNKQALSRSALTPGLRRAYAASYNENPVVTSSDQYCNIPSILVFSLLNEVLLRVKVIT